MWTSQRSGKSVHLLASAGQRNLPFEGAISRFHKTIIWKQSQLFCSVTMGLLFHHYLCSDNARTLRVATNIRTALEVCGDYFAVAIYNETVRKITSIVNIIALL